jgi:hypothetical protein
VALGYAGAAATGLQCINGLYRLYDLVENGGEDVAWLDSQGWYNATSTALDLISLASAGGVLKEVVTTWRAMKSVSSLKASQWLKEYPRQDRKRLTELIIKLQNPGISNKEIKALIRAGIYPKRFPVEPVQVELTRQLGNLVTSAAALAGSAVSGVVASPGNIPKPGDTLRTGSPKQAAILWAPFSRWRYCNAPDHAHFWLVFCDLLAHGREMEQVIARGDNSLLQHSTPELERWFDKPPSELPRQNGFPLAFVLLFFLVAFACNLLTLMSMLPRQTPPTRALFFLPAILFIFSNLTATWLIARGKTSGLAWYGLVHGVLTVLSAVLLAITVLNGQMHHAVIMLVAMLIMLACRYVLNGRGFILFVLYSRTQRIATLSRGMRIRSGQ